MFVLKPYDYIKSEPKWSLVKKLHYILLKKKNEMKTKSKLDYLKKRLFQKMDLINDESHTQTHMINQHTWRAYTFIYCNKAH